MYRNQKQVMDSFVRVRSFLDAYPTTGALTYASAREMLDDVVQRLRAEQIALLFDQYMRPLVTIARATA